MLDKPFHEPCCNIVAPNYETAVVNVTPLLTRVIVTNRSNTVHNKLMLNPADCLIQPAAASDVPPRVLSRWCKTEAQVARSSSTTTTDVAGIERSGSHDSRSETSFSRHLISPLACWYIPFASKLLPFFASRSKLCAAWDGPSSSFS